MVDGVGALMLEGELIGNVRVYWLELFSIDLPRERLKSSPLCEPIEEVICVSKFLSLPNVALEKVLWDALFETSLSILPTTPRSFKMPDLMLMMLFDFDLDRDPCLSDLLDAFLNVPVDLCDLANDLDLYLELFEALLWLLKVFFWSIILGSNESFRILKDPFWSYLFSRLLSWSLSLFRSGALCGCF